MQAKSLLALLLVGVASFALGWYARDVTFEVPVAREVKRTRPPSALENAAATERAIEALRERRQAERKSEDDAPPFKGPEGEPPAPEGGETEDTETASGNPTPDPIEEMVKSLGPQWKAMAKMQVRPKIQALLAALGFDEETSKLIEEAILKDVDLAMDRVMGMMTGAEEMDADAMLYFMGLPPDLSPNLERDLAVFLNDGEIAQVRTEVKKSYDRSLTDMADSQIGMMALPSLTADQTTRLREVFRGKNFMQEQFKGFAEMTSDRQLFAKAASGEIDVGAEIRKSLEPQKRRVAEILTPEQMAGWDRYEQSMVAQAEMGMKMMTAMFEQPPQPPAKSDNE